MDLIAIFQKYPAHESCIEHLENLRWTDKPVCHTLWRRIRSA